MLSGLTNLTNPVPCPSILAAMAKKHGSQTVNLYEAKTRLSELVDRAAAGEEIVIAKAGSPKARLVPVSRTGKPRKPGGWEGQIWIADDFDAPLPSDILKRFVE